MIKITSPNFENNSEIPKDFTCDGKGLMPDLKIEGVPAEAKSLVLIIEDPDAPAGLWTHFLAANIDPKTEAIVSGQIPAGAMLGKTSAGSLGYHGPCPPSGTHRYFFKIYALDFVLDLKESYQRTELEDTIKNHVLDSGELIGLYSRTR